MGREVLGRVRAPFGRWAKSTASEPPVAARTSTVGGEFWAPLRRAAADLGVRPDTMRHVTPLGWEHLSVTGDYAWDANAQPAPGELRPFRTKPSLLAA